MKTIAILLLAAVSLTTTGCFTEVEYSTGSGLRSANKPLADVDLADSEEELGEGEDPIAAEDVIVDGEWEQRFYFRDGRVVIEKI